MSFSDGLSWHSMVSTTSSVELLFLRSAGGSGSRIVREMHPGGHAVCMATTTKRSRNEAVRSDGWTKRVVGILVRRRASHTPGCQSQCYVR